MAASIQASACSTKARGACLLRRLFESQQGSISIIVAVSFPVLLGFGGLAVDVSLWLRAKNSVQGATDFAASSAAAAAVRGSDFSAEVLGVAAANGFQNGKNGVVVSINNPPISGTYAGNKDAYEVIITAQQRLYLANYFSAAFGLKAPTVAGRAVALSYRTSPTCILALSPTAPSNGTMATNGGANLTANNCDVDDDSPSAKSINSDGNGTIYALNVNTVGGIDGGVHIAATEQVRTYGAYIADPYLGQRSIPSLPPFQPASANSWGKANSTVSIANPTGVIAYQGDVTVKGTVNLAPGVYIIADGSFNSSGVLNGTGVTIVLTTTGKKTTGAFSFSGGAAMNLTAPTTGTTRGITLWADRQLNLDTSDNFVGGSTNGIVGAIYLPSHLVKFAGNQGAVTRCTQMIADMITFTGTPTFNHNCDGIPILDPVVTWSIVE